MACMLRVSVRRALGEELLAARPFGRREMVEGGGPRERGKGPWMGLNIRVDALDERGWLRFRGQVASARRFLRRYDKPLRALTGDARFSTGGLDFGVGDAIDGGRGPAAVSFYRLPADLLAMAGDLGLDVELSIYPVNWPSPSRMTKSRPRWPAAGR